MNKKAITLGSIIATLIIGGVLLFVLFLNISDAELPEKLRLFLPIYSREPSKNITDYGFDCIIQVAKITESYINFCLDKNCTETEKSSIYISDSEIKLDEKWSGDESIGNIQADTFISVKRYLLEGVGDERDPNSYYDIKENENLPNYERLLSLHDSYFLTSGKKEICRREPIKPEEERNKVLETTREINVKGKTFYFNMDDFIRNKGSSETLLYLDPQLNTKAKSIILLSSQESRGTINLIPEEGEKFAAETIETDLFNKKDIYLETDKVFYEAGNSFSTKRYITDRLNVDKETEWLTLKKPIANENNKLGFDTDENPLNQIKYAKFLNQGNIEVYIKLRTTIGFDDEMNFWVKKDYWDAYGSLARVPDWAVKK